MMHWTALWSIPKPQSLSFCNPWTINLFFIWYQQRWSPNWNTVALLQVVHSSSMIYTMQGSCLLHRYMIVLHIS